MKRLSILIAALVMSAISAFGQYEEYSRKVFTGPGGDKLNYRILLPEGMEQDGKYPLVLFLHGAGERGDDNESQLRHGGAMFLNPVNRDEYPAVVIFPQCPSDGWWISSRRPVQVGEAPVSTSLKLVEELIRECIANLPVDRRRVYVVGLSMGGMGTFDIVCRNPDLFAAAVPICGAANNSMLTSELRHTNFRIYHGDADATVEYRYSREAYLALKKAGVNVDYVEMPGIAHDSWTPAFNRPDFMSWLFSQRRKR